MHVGGQRGKNCFLLSDVCTLCTYVLCTIGAGLCAVHNVGTEYGVQWNPSNPDTLGPESTVLIIEMSSCQGLSC